MSELEGFDSFLVPFFRIEFKVSNIATFQSSCFFISEMNNEKLQASHLPLSHVVQGRRSTQNILHKVCVTSVFSSKI